MLIIRNINLFFRQAELSFELPTTATPSSRQGIQHFFSPAPAPSSRPATEVQTPTYHLRQLVRDAFSITDDEFKRYDTQKRLKLSGGVGERFTTNEDKLLKLIIARKPHRSDGKPWARHEKNFRMYSNMLAQARPSLANTFHSRDSRQLTYRAKKYSS